MKVILPLTSLIISYSIFVNYIAVTSSFENSRSISCPNFGTRTYNFSLKDGIFRTFSVELEVQCMYECMVDKRCLSYNYNPKSFGCELSRTDKFSGRANFSYTIGYVHRGIVTPCDSFPCATSETCTPNYDTSSYKCESPCKTGWQIYNGACYKFFKRTKKAWQDAIKACSAEGAHLVSIHSAAENDFVHSTVTYMDGEVRRGWSWIGFNNMTAEGRFVWSDGSPNGYTNWHPGKPSGGSKNCAFLSSRGPWNNYPCSHAVPFTCKYKF